MKTSYKRWISAIIVLLVSGVIAWFATRPSNNDLAEIDPHETVENLVASEEWITAMSAHLSKFTDHQLSVPIELVGLTQFFSESYRHQTLGHSAAPEPVDAGSGVRVTEYAFDASVAASDTLWPFLEGKVQRLEPGKFGFLSGSFTDAERRQFAAKLSFSSPAKLTTGWIASLQTQQTVSWEIDTGATPPSAATDYHIDPSQWHITGWTTTSATLTEAPRPLFEDVTAEVIPSSIDRELAETSLHTEYLKKLFKGEQIPLPKGMGEYFTTDATGQHPGLAVVDIDNDGWDDLYVCVRWGRNLLFRNQGNGTFKEEAERFGLDIAGLTAAAIFADFDNDGDQDAFLARTLTRCLYLENENGHFSDRSDTHVSGSLPLLGTSLAAADYNSDGLLDLYIATYGFAARNPRQAVARDFLSDYPPDAVQKRFVSPPDYEPFINLPGPPNVLLINVGGGRFEISPLSEQVAAWRETLQATWADYDRDGDPDLYVCNDFAPDQLYRNDGGENFVDVTATEGHPRMMGFGMGASFGDYDNDQDLDLYVSNMYSKAGLRITDLAGTLDHRLRWSAEGNLLFGNRGGRGFDLLSGKGDPLHVVAKADWSWGGQFIDIDNDSFLDLYVPNGYYTAPEGFGGEEDL